MLPKDELDAVRIWAERWIRNGPPPMADISPDTLLLLLDDNAAVWPFVEEKAKEICELRIAVEGCQCLPCRAREMKLEREGEA